MKNIIDVHSHVPPKRVPGAKPQWPSSPWSEEALLKFMEEVGISTTVLTEMKFPDTLPTVEEAKEYARARNEADFALKKKYPGQIEYAAVAPFSDPGAAVEEIKYAYDHLGACAVVVGSNVKGIYLGNEKFEPIFDELERRKGTLFLHPAMASAFPRNHATGEHLPLYEFVVDTSRTVLDMIFTGMLKRHPNVKIVVPHAGSFLPALHDRINGLTGILNDHDWMQRVDMTEAMNNSLWYDLGCDVMPSLLKQLLTVAPAEHVMFGTDFPPIPAHSNIDKIKDMEAADYLQPHLDGIFRENAKKLLNI